MNEMTRQQLDAYLDGALNHADRERFERELSHDSELRRSLEDQQRINASLQRLFPVQASDSARALLAKIGSISDRPHRVETSRRVSQTNQRDPKWWRRWLAAAAVFAICAFAVWANRSYYFPKSTHFVTGNSHSIEHFYRAKTAAGYTPQIAFQGSAAFASLVRERFGQPLSISTLPAKFSIEGIDHCDMLSEHTLAVIMDIDGRDVVVLIDQVAAAPHEPLSAACQLHTFEVLVGNLKLVEVTPWPDARALALFKSP